MDHKLTKSMKRMTSHGKKGKSLHQKTLDSYWVRTEDLGL